MACNKWIYLAVRVYEYTLTEAQGFLGLHYSTISVIAKRVAEERVHQNPMVDPCLLRPLFVDKPRAFRDVPRFRADLIKELHGRRMARRISSGDVPFGRETEDSERLQGGVESHLWCSRLAPTLRLLLV